MRKIKRGILQTYSGRVISLTRPDPRSFHARDIAEGLAKVCRFSGQVHGYYSVAAHTLNVYALVRLAGGTLQEQLAALLHDATEAYIADLPSPAKIKCPGYVRLEKRLNKAIAKRFNAPETMPAIVKWADDEMLDYERGLLFHGRCPDLKGAGEIYSLIPQFLNALNHVLDEIWREEQWNKKELYSDFY